MFEQAAKQQQWFELRMERTLPALMRRDGIDMWVVPMRESIRLASGRLACESQRRGVMPLVLLQKRSG